MKEEFDALFAEHQKLLGELQAMRAVAKSKQEPVGEAYLCDRCHTPFDGAYECPSCGHNEATKEFVYTTPPQRKPLTDEEIMEIADGCLVGATAWHNPELDPIKFARAIEAAHGIKEKNT